MISKFRIGIVFSLILLLVAGAVYAQSDGSIRGTVYQDTNADGKCVGTGELFQAGIPIKFVSSDGKHEIFLDSGADGTFGLVAVGLGTWNVSAQPSSEWIVTSANPRQVFLSAEQPTVPGVDFCVAKAGTKPQSTATPVVGTVLPESGATIAPTLVAILAIGSGFVITGATMEIFRRRRN